MLWVGGGIIVHGLEHFELHLVPDFIAALSQTAQGVAGIGAATGWLVSASGGAVVGFIVGGAILVIAHGVGRA